MAERVEPLHALALAGEVRWEPNAPEACLVSDDQGRGALAQRAHPDDSDQRCVVLRWDLVVYAQMGPPNDEARPHHRLYEVGLGNILWVGVVRDSGLVSALRPTWGRAGGDLHLMPMHFVVVSKECVVEVVAADVDLLRIAGDTYGAAAASLSA